MHFIALLIFAVYFVAAVDIERRDRSPSPRRQSLNDWDEPAKDQKDSRFASPQVGTPRASPDPDSMVGTPFQASPLFESWDAPTSKDLEIALELLSLDKPATLSVHRGRVTKKRSQRDRQRRRRQRSRAPSPNLPDLKDAEMNQPRNLEINN